MSLKPTKQDLKALAEINGLGAWATMTADEAAQAAQNVTDLASAKLIMEKQNRMIVSLRDIVLMLIKEK